MISCEHDDLTTGHVDLTRKAKKKKVKKVGEGQAYMVRFMGCLDAGGPLQQSWEKPATPLCHIPALEKKGRRGQEESTKKSTTKTKPRTEPLQLIQVVQRMKKVTAKRRRKGSIQRYEGTNMGDL